MEKIKTAFDTLEPENALVAKSIFIKLISLGFVADFKHCEVGPVVSTYFYKPTATSLLSKIMSRTEDIAMAVGAESVLIRREKDEVTVSVPNSERVTVNFDKCLYSLLSRSSSEGFRKELPLLMGVTPTGDNFSIDLCEQPHILIAGSTGSGKSVFLSQLITSLVVQKAPSELSLYLVDTKQLDLTLFSALPHIAELVTKVEVLHHTLHYLLGEVRQRTARMEGRARNIAEWNALARTEKMDYKILIIDELADVIGQDKELAENEDKDGKRTRISLRISSLAQISRAAGIHIIAATQRPSVQIVNGDIKANFPSRICFKLPSGTDSRVVLDENGAECLLGKGDYLYKTATDSTIKRAHSAFVSMEDIRRIIEQNEFIRQSLRRD